VLPKLRFSKPSNISSILVKEMIMNCIVEILLMATDKVMGPLFREMEIIIRAIGNLD
jgi:hypothetical protein